MRKTAILLAMLMLCVTALAEPLTITVRGTGIVSMEPDTATIMLGVRETSKDVGAAQSAVSAKLTKVIESLIAEGIKAEDIHTGAISIYQNYDYSASDTLAYWAENTINVRFTDIENAGKYIDLVAQSGANTFNGISFSASDTEEAKKRALELSVENARKKADVLAAAAGMRVTGVQAIRTEDYGDFGSVYYNSNTYDAMYAKAAGVEVAVETPVMADQIQISASVTIEYAMEPVE